ncbi:corticotropin-releasing factor receptor 1-like [Tachypleus tridentatus]|uniref:corticotropin-releasing factor receptor 1-like n=1 Tax=Tachypleus tridentatus TaxID=6853 RepID=UPI003FD4F325
MELSFISTSYILVQFKKQNFTVPDLRTKGLTTSGSLDGKKINFPWRRLTSLQCPRLRVHLNLVIALIIHSILLIIISSSGVLGEHFLWYVNIDLLCKTILSLKMYAAMASINWMFIEGLLLNSRITVSVFSKDAPFKLYNLIGWGLPLLFIISWSIIMAWFLNTPCWKGYGKTYYIWIVTGPMITALIVNTIFLINVVRILVTKLRKNNSTETAHVRKAIKATALLFPLLGITHLLFCINLHDDGHLERAYMITNALFQSSQGLFVAVLYCFMNSEVQTALRNAYQRVILRRNPNHRLKYGRCLSRTSATYLTSYDTTLIDATRPKVSPFLNIHESMDPSCLVSTVQAGCGGVMVWGMLSQKRLAPFISNEHHVNATAYLRIVAEHVHPLKIIVYLLLSGYFQQHKVACHKAFIISNCFTNMTVTPVFTNGLHKPPDLDPVEHL